MSRCGNVTFTRFCKRPNGMHYEANEKILRIFSAKWANVLTESALAYKSRPSRVHSEWALMEERGYSRWTLPGGLPVAFGNWYGPEFATLGAHGHKKLPRTSRLLTERPVSAQSTSSRKHGVNSGIPRCSLVEILARSEFAQGEHVMHSGYPSLPLLHPWCVSTKLGLSSSGYTLGLFLQRDDPELKLGLSTRSGLLCDSHLTYTRI